MLLSHTQNTLTWLRVYFVPLNTSEKALLNDSPKFIPRLVCEPLSVCESPLLVLEVIVAVIELKKNVPNNLGGVLWCLNIFGM